MRNIERQLGKSLPINQSPVSDSSDDLDNEEFVNANDPENKFVPIEEVADPDSDFSDENWEKKLSGKEISSEEVAEEVAEEAADADKIEEIRRNISSDYSFKHRGSKYGNLEAFHVDHDKEEMLAVGDTDGEFDYEDEDEDEVEDENELELAGINNETKRKEVFDKHEYNSEKGVGHENLKTWDDNKHQRNKRGIIRSFLNRFN